jgi:serine/threonine-protein kinase HipA
MREFRDYFESELKPRLDEFELRRQGLAHCLRKLGGGCLLLWVEEVRSGQLPPPAGFSYWLLKFDGVTGNKDKELDDPRGFGRVEFAYYHMAKAAGIEMSECRILSKNNRHHFMTRRFDRTDNGGKLHMQTLGALAHYDFNQAGGHSYEQAMQVMRRLDFPMTSTEQQFRRVVFNVLARNQDDHVKNIAYLMDKSGNWSLSPAYDSSYSYNPYGKWTAQHQMSINGKRDDFQLEDFVSLARMASMKRGRARTIVAEVADAISHWSDHGEIAGVADARIAQIGAAHRLL